MLKIAICDDEQSICSKLEKMILNFKKEYREEIIVEVFYSGSELYNYIATEHSFDVIFLDIEMKTLNGIDVGKKIRKEMNDYNTKLIYISGKDSYDRMLFDVQPLHFLSKPLDEKKVVEDLILALRLSDNDETVFSYKVGQETCRIKLKNIIYFESEEREVKIITTEDKIERFYATMDFVLSEVEKCNFIRIHRRFIINFNQVVKFKSSEVVMSNGDTLSIGQSKRKEVKEFQISYEVGGHIEF